MYRLSNHFLDILQEKEKIVSKNIFCNMQIKLMDFTKSYFKSPRGSYFLCTNVFCVKCLQQSQFKETFYRTIPGFVIVFVILL